MSNVKCEMSNVNEPKATSDVKPMLPLRGGLDRTERTWDYRRSQM